MDFFWNNPLSLSLCSTCSFLPDSNDQSLEEISSQNMNAQAHFPVSLPPEGGNCKVDDLRKIITKCVTTGKNGGDVKYYLTEFFYHKSRLVLIELTTSFLVGEGARKTLGAKLGKNLRPTWHLKLCLSHSLRLQLLKEGCPIHTNGVSSSNYYRS